MLRQYRNYIKKDNIEISMFVSRFSQPDTTQKKSTSVNQNKKKKKNQQ